MGKKDKIKFQIPKINEYQQYIFNPEIYSRNSEG